MRPRLLPVSALAAAALSGSLLASVAPAQAARPSSNTLSAAHPLGHAVSPPLRSIHAQPPATPPAFNENRQLPHHSSTRTTPTATGSMQTSPSSVAAPPSNGTFEGLDNQDLVLPPDTNGAIGGNYYVQWVNLHYAVYTRSGTQVLNLPGSAI